MKTPNLNFWPRLVVGLALSAKKISRVALALLAVCFFVLDAEAQYLDNLTNAWSKAPTAAYSTRKVISTYDGPAMRLRRSNDHQMVDVYFDSNGWISMSSNVSDAVGYAAAAASEGTTTLETWVGSNSAYVMTWYDQSGNNNHATHALVTGTITANNTVSVTGTGTKFTTELANGYKLYDAVTGSYITTCSGGIGDGSFNASSAVTIAAGTTFFVREHQPLFINAGVIQTMPNGRPSLNVQNGANTGANGLVTPMTLSADANVNVFAVAERMAQSSTVDGMIIGNFPNGNSASVGNFSAGYSTTTSLGLRSTLYASASPTVLRQSYALRYYANALKNSQANENSNIVQLDSLGNTTTGTAVTGTIGFTSTTKLSLFKPIAYGTRGFTGYCPEVIYYASTTPDQEFNSTDAAAWLENQRYNLINYTPVVTAPINVTSTSLTFNWKNGDPNLGTIGTDYTYKIQYSTSLSFTSPTEVVVSSGSSPFSYNISGLTAGTTYYIRIRLEKTSGYTSGWSVPYVFGLSTKVGETSPFKTIQAAYDAIKAIGTIAQPYTIELQNDYIPGNETYPINLTAIAGASATNTITIKPAAGVKKTIENTNTTSIFTGVTALTTTSAVLNVTQPTTNLAAGMTVYGYGPYSGSAAHPTVSSFTANTITCSRNMSAAITSPATTTIYVGPANTKTINFNGARYVIIDGVSRDAASTTGLTIQNPNNIQASTIWIDGGSQYNTIQNCYIKGANVSGMAYNNGGCGQIMFYNGENDFNTITNNDICDIDGLPMPNCMILMTYGTSSANNDNTISNNKIYNIGNGTSPNGNTSFVNFSSTSAATSYNNFILNNRMYWTKIAVFRTNPYIIGMGGNYNGLGNRIEGNTIGWQADGTTRAEITAPLNTALTFYGTNVKNCTLKNNIIGGINYASGNFVGFQLFSHNTSTTNADDICYGNEVKDITVTSSVTTGDSRIRGFLISGTNPFDFNIKNNIIKNLTITSTTNYPSYAYGIDFGAVSSSYKISYIGNEISNLTAGKMTSANTNKVWGLKTAICSDVVEKNLIYDLHALSSGSPEVDGIVTNNIGLTIPVWSTGSKAANVYCYWGNNVYKCTTAGTATAGNAPTVTSGTKTDGTLVWTYQFTLNPNTTYKNNIIRLGVNNAAGDKTNTNIYGIYHSAQFNANDVNKFYHNSIYIGGTASASATQNSFAFYQAGAVVPTTLDLKNNIFANQRAFDTGGTPTGKNYAVGYATAGVIKSSDNNLYFSNLLGLATGSTPADKTSLADWKNVVNATGSDALSIEGDPLFLSPATTIPDLHIASNSPVIGQGENLFSTVSDDYDGAPRADANGDMGADTRVKGFLKGSGNWSSLSVWDDGVLPSSTDDVTIPSGRTLNVDITNAVANNLTNAGTLTINAGQALALSGNLTNNADSTGLVIKSDATGTGQLKVNGSATGRISFERYMAGKKFHLLSAPVEGQSITRFLTNPANTNISSGNDGVNSFRGLADYNSTTNAWNAYFTNSTAGNFDSGKGFLIRTKDAVGGSVKITGTPQTSNVNIAVNKDWNCIGNPYTAALDISGVINANSGLMNPSFANLYVWEYSGDPETGSYKPYTSGAIQSGQAFFVRVNNETTLFPITTNMTSVSPSTPFRSTSVNNWTSVKLSATNGTDQYNTEVKFNESMTKGLDVTYDAGLFRANKNFAIYTRLLDDNGIDFCLQALPTTMEAIPVGLDYTSGGKITFTASSFPVGYQVILEDRQAKTFSDLSLTNATYTAEVAANTQGTGRFYLYANPSKTSTGMNSDSKTSSLSAYFTTDALTIKGEVSDRAVATICDITGKVVLSTNLKPATIQSLPVNLSKGIYIVNVVDGDVSVQLKLNK